MPRQDLCSERRRPGEDPEGSELWLSHGVCHPDPHREPPALETLLSGWNAGSGAGEPHGSVGAGVQRAGSSGTAPGPGPAEPAVPQGCSGTCPPPTS